MNYPLLGLITTLGGILCIFLLHQWFIVPKESKIGLMEYLFLLGMILSFIGFVIIPSLYGV